MMHPCNCSLFRLLVVMCIVLHGLGKTTEAFRTSCEVTRSTKQVVDDCPDSEEKWKERAAIKNCTAFASQCAEPERLVYHCLINQYVNQTLEVCAYAQNIVFGLCASYSFSGNSILLNLRTNCSAFKEKPCPNFYRSDKAYNYPECYELTKKSTTVAYISKTMSNQDKTSVPTTLSSNESSNTHEDKTVIEEMVKITIPVVVIGTLAIILLIVLIYLRRKNGKTFCEKPFQKGSKKSNDARAEKMKMFKTYEKHHDIV
ncbi:uncharacterized protein LOC128183784 [Crassostrea angulata]|uniref:uncharacterized protein LOC128183784 n=1 Tax=Magallana angulata TaxID=2784310 RepID=UPI0022B0839E|nr:uncharacterized protein LOC128183784 [Crassostrea angulata]